MKRQIHAVRGHEQVTVPGHDLKLGRGGIREIEFFVQTQQLIFGGRRPTMRGARTLEMLRAIARRALGRRRGGRRSDERLYASCAASSIACRWSPTSRRSACRSSPTALARFATFCGYARLEAFAAEMTRSSARRREALRAPVRGRADARRRGGQSGLHRRRRRSRDPRDLAPPRLPAAGRGRRDHSRLAFRPPPGGAQRARARSADRTRSGAACRPFPARAIPTRR